MHNIDIGIRMKEQYEHRAKQMLPRRTYTIVRLDGKAFHTWTHATHREKPFDSNLMGLMRATAIFLCQEIQGAQFAYTQSDEISVLLTDFSQIMTQAWFEGNVQKIVSVAAALATGTFNAMTHVVLHDPPLAFFDACVFTIPDPVEVYNYFVWRQQDATRNSIQMVAQSLYSHKELHGKNSNQLQEMIFQKGQNWNDYPSICKRGTIIRKIIECPPTEPFGGTPAPRTTWVGDLNTPIFTQEHAYLRNMIPLMGVWSSDQPDKEAS